MVNIGDSVTLKKKTTGESMSGKVVGYKVKLDNPIVIEAAGYNSILSEIEVPGYSKTYEIVKSGGGRKTRKVRKGRKGTRRVR
jgi:hypothetical protein